MVARRSGNDSADRRLGRQMRKPHFQVRLCVPLPKLTGGMCWEHTLGAGAVKPAG